MIVQPKIRGYICTTAHPVGCARHVQEQIDFVKSRPALSQGPKKVLVIGASTGYGLASRIVPAFASGAATLGVFYERPAENKRTATAGWYNSVAFENAARKAGLYARSINGDAFADELKSQVIETIRQDLGKIDLVVYSLASPRRTDPKTGQIYKSVLRPKDKPYTNKSMDFEAGKVVEVTLPPATPEEIEGTIGVMGGDDWELWIEALLKAGVLSPGAISVAYSYIGPDVTTPVYRNGTIGAAKDHIEATAHKLHARLQQAIGGQAFISVNKALVTQSSSAIPFIPLYFVILKKVMKAKGLEENCIQQIQRLFAQRLYTGQAVLVDAKGRIRVDDLEMREDVQREVKTLWEQIDTANVRQLADVAGYEEDFLKLFGFGFADVNYEADVEVDVSLSQ